MTRIKPDKARSTRFLTACVLVAALAGLPQSAFAACTSPTGIAGDVIYNGTYNVLQYCNGAGWVNAGTWGAGGGALVSGDFCTSNGTVVNCSTPSTGGGNVVLSTSPTITGSLVGASSTWSGTVAATAFTGNGAGLTGLGTSSLTAVTGTANSGTYLRGDGTWASATGAGISGGIANNFAVWSSATSLGTSTIYQNGSNVGIGTASSSYPLAVNGIVSATTYVATSNGTAGGPAYSIGNSGTGMFIPAAGSLALSSNGSEWLRINGSGNVSIGTSTANGALNVNGTVTATTLSGAHTGSGAGLTGIGTSSLSATGTPTATTYLAGNNTWATIAPTFSGLTTGDFCTASSSATVGCAIGTTGTGSVVLSASPTFSGTVTGGTFAGTHTGSGAGLTGIGISALGGIGGTPSASVYLRGDGTWAAVSSGTTTGAGTANYVTLWNGATSLGTSSIYQSGSNIGIGTTTASNSLTVNGTLGLMFGTSYSTAGTQSDVAISTSASVRYTGTAVATFNGIVAGSNGQIMTLHNGSASILTLANLAAADTTVANQIATGTGSNLNLAANSAVILQYDATATNSGGNTGAWRVIGGTGGTAAGATGQVQYNSGSNSFAATTNFAYSAANGALVVGTGAATPVGTSGSVASFVYNVIPQSSTYTVAAGSGGTSVNSAAAGQLAYYSTSSAVSGTSALYVSGGNVGIGTTTPGTSLDVDQNTSGRAALSNVAIGLHVTGANGSNTGVETTTYAATPLYNGVVYGGTLASPVAIGTSQILLSLNGYGYDGSVATTSAAANISIVAAGGGAWTTTSHPANITFGTTPSGSVTRSERMRIDNLGNVGIGTTNPVSNLEVLPSTSSGVFIAPGVLTTTDARIGAITAAASTSTPLEIEGYPVRFVNGGTGGETMRIDTGGNVGIGTAAPDSLLEGYTTATDTNDQVSHLYSVANVSGTSTTSLRLEKGSGYGGDVAGYIAQGVGSGLKFSALNGGSLTEVMRLTNGGNVGIGTAIPSAYLNAYGATQPQMQVTAPSGSNAYMALTPYGTGTHDWWIGSAGVGNGNGVGKLLFGDNTSSAIRMVIDTSGNVGIGTAIPLASMAVEGAVRTENVGYGQIGVMYIDANGFEIESANWANTTKKSINLAGYGGNVGIGVLAPTARLGIDTNSNWGSLSIAYNGAAAFAGGFNNTDTGTAGQTVFNFLRNGTSVGSIYTTNTATTFATSSDRRLKENFKPTARGIDDVMRIPVQDFNFINDTSKLRVQGFIAQDLYKIYPEAVSTNGDDGSKPLAKDAQPWRVDYGRLTPLVVKAVQDLKNLFDTDHDSIAKLQAENSQLKAANDQAMQAIHDLRRDFEDYKKVHP